MADLNALIAQGAQFRQAPDPFVQFGQMQQLEQGRQTNELNQMKMQEAQATMAERNALRQLNPSAADYESQLFKVNPTLGIAYRKEASAAGAQKAAQQLSEVKAAETKQQMLGQAYRDISSRPSDANITAHMEDVLASTLFTPEEKAKVQKQSATLLSMPVEGRSSFLASQGAKSSELNVKPTPEQPDVATMRALGYPLTQDGYKAFREAQRTERPDRLLTPDEEAQKVRLAIAGRAPALPRPEQPPVAVIGSDGKPVLVTREQSFGMTPAAAMESLSPKEIQKREAALPQATSAVKGFESKSDKFIADLTALRDDPGLDNITGPVFGRTGSVSQAGSRAQAVYDKVVAKGGFQALQDLRDASKTGGALGNVSNIEGQQLKASFAAIDRRQNADDVRAAINQAIEDIKGTKARMREAYDSTYAYKSGGESQPSKPASAAPNIDALLNKYK